MSCVSLFGSSTSCRYRIFLDMQVFCQVPCLLVATWIHVVATKRRLCIRRKFGLLNCCRKIIYIYIYIYIYLFIYIFKKIIILFFGVFRSKCGYGHGQKTQRCQQVKATTQGIHIDVVGFLYEGQVCLFVTKLFCFFFVFFHVSNYFFYDYVDKVSSFSSKFTSIANVKWYW
jgi:hypothetical protein